MHYLSSSFCPDVCIKGKVHCPIPFFQVAPCPYPPSRAAEHPWSKSRGDRWLRGLNLHSQSTDDSPQRTVFNCSFHWINLRHLETCWGAVNLEGKQTLQVTIALAALYLKWLIVLILARVAIYKEMTFYGVSQEALEWRLQCGQTLGSRGWMIVETKTSWFALRSSWT